MTIDESVIKAVRLAYIDAISLYVEITKEVDLNKLPTSWSDLFDFINNNDEKALSRIGIRVIYSANWDYPATYEVVSDGTIIDLEIPSILGQEYRKWSTVKSFIRNEVLIDETQDTEPTEPAEPNTINDSDNSDDLNKTLVTLSPYTYQPTEFNGTYILYAVAACLVFWGVIGLLVLFWSK